MQPRTEQACEFSRKMLGRSTRLPSARMTAGRSGRKAWKLSCAYPLRPAIATKYKQSHLQNVRDSATWQCRRCQESRAGNGVDYQCAVRRRQRVRAANMRGAVVIMNQEIAGESQGQKEETTVSDGFKHRSMRRGVRAKIQFVQMDSL